MDKSRSERGGSKAEDLGYAHGEALRPQRGNLQVRRLRRADCLRQAWQTAGRSEHSEACGVRRRKVAARFLGTSTWYERLAGAEPKQQHAEAHHPSKSPVDAVRPREAHAKSGNRPNAAPASLPLNLGPHGHFQPSIHHANERVRWPH
eukprot:354316-Chlamydomonas_euryale.AAC.5